MLGIEPGASVVLDEVFHLGQCLLAALFTGLVQGPDTKGAAADAAGAGTVQPGRLEAHRCERRAGEIGHVMSSSYRRSSLRSH